MDFFINYDTRINVNFFLINFIMFYDHVHFQQDLDNHSLGFDLINFNLIKVGKFHFKEFLNDEDDSTLVNISAFINGSFKSGFIDLSERLDLLSRIKILTPKENSRQINDLILFVPGIDLKTVERMQAFMHLGIEVSLDQEIINSSNIENILDIPNLFDRVLLGETVELKIENYRQKRSKIKRDSQDLIILDNLFKIGLSIKIFNKEVLLNQIPCDLRVDEFYIDKMFLDKSVLILVRTGCESVLRLLLSEPGKISNIFFQLSVIEASKYGHESIVRFFLLEYGKISYDYFYLSVVEAAKGGYESIVRFLLLECGEISLEHLIIIIVEAVKNNQNHIVSLFLLELNGVSKKDIENFVVQLVKNGHESIINIFLLEHEEISCETLRAVIIQSIENGNESIVRFFSKKYKVFFHENYEIFVSNAVKNGHESIVRFIFSEIGEIPLEIINMMILAYINVITPNILEFILQQGPIYLDIKNSAMVIAEQNLYRYQIRELLLIAPVFVKPKSSSKFYKCISISLDSLKNNPGKYLHLFSKLNNFPNSFILKNSIQNLDLDSISKKVISMLFSSLHSKYYYYWYPWEFLISQKDGIKISDLKFYEDLAKVLSLIDKKNKYRSDKFLIEKIFNTSFFNLLKVYNKSIDCEKIKNVFLQLKIINPCYYPLYEYYLNPTSENKELYKIFIKDLDESLEDIDDLFLFSFLYKQVTKIIEPILIFLRYSSISLKEKIFIDDKNKFLFAS